MSEFYRKKRMTKLIGYGALIVIPLVLVLSIVFSEIKMANELSIFLIVLISSIAIFAYYLLFAHFEKKKFEKKKNFDDPFNK